MKLESGNEKAEAKLRPFPNYSYVIAHGGTKAQFKQPFLPDV